MAAMWFSLTLSLTPVALALAAVGSWRFEVPAWSGIRIPVEHTCDGADLSPALRWQPIPGARYLALELVDPDAPVGTWVHWLWADLPAAGGSVPIGVPTVARPPQGGVQGRNDFGRLGYGGPCPPHGHGPHRYVFHVWALAEPLDLAPGFTRQQLQAALEAHRPLAESTVVGRYER